MLCSICKEREATVSLPKLYPFGSEGIRICHPCQLKITEVIVEMTLAEQRKRFESRKGVPKRPKPDTT